MKNIFNFFRKYDIGKSPWDYNFLVNLDEKEYPKYLAKIFKYRTGEKLPLRFDFKNQAWIIDKKKCKTFNQKLQWIKLYGVTDLMRKCTDKVAVRDYVRERIGEEYLKPVLQIIPDDKSTPHPNPLPLGEGTNSKIQGFNQKMKADKLGGHSLPSGEGWGEGTALASKDVSTYFDQINWNKLPNAFVLKCNHGSKWQYIIKDKEQFLNTPQLFEIVKRQMTGWLEQEYFPWNGFEMQYATSRSAKKRAPGGVFFEREVVSHNSNSGVRTRLREGIACNSDNEASDLPEKNGCQEKGIKPKILIETFFQNEDNTPLREVEVYCFNHIPKFIINIHNEKEISIYNENLKLQKDVFGFKERKINTLADKLIQETINLSKDLSKYFSFVRIDWMLYKNKIYFEELTFTPYSGFNKLNRFGNRKIGKYLNL